MTRSSGRNEQLVEIAAILANGYLRAHAESRRFQKTDGIEPNHSDDLSLFGLDSPAPTLHRSDPTVNRINSTERSATDG
ncbi:MAG: hypothetical protein KOO63_03575 [Bacteroidales bacterium]|nr:hypothetical protein [Candidatus Latescibacterota bacterium]